MHRLRPSSVAALLLVLFVYMALSRLLVLVPNTPYVTLEIARTVLRVIGLCIAFPLLRNVIGDVKPLPIDFADATVLVTVLVVLLGSYAGINGGSEKSPWAVQAVLAATASVVAGFEELVFRVFLFAYLMRFIGLWPALVVNAVAFTLFHYGVQPIEGLARILEYSSSAAILCLLYAYTGRLWVPLLTHFVIDVIAFGPFVSHQVPLAASVALELFALAMMVGGMWAYRRPVRTGGLAVAVPH